MLNRKLYDCLFSFYRVEEQHVQFRVNQNPQNVDADNMVDNIGKCVKKYTRWKKTSNVNGGHQNVNQLSNFRKANLLVPNSSSIGQ